MEKQNIFHLGAVNYFIAGNRINRISEKRLDTSTGETNWFLRINNVKR